MAKAPEKTDKNGIQVIARAAAVLRALKGAHTGMSLSEIAEAVALPRSTVQRIAGALLAERLLITNANGRGFRLGPELAALAENARYNIVESCRLVLGELAHKTGETADLSVLRGAAMIFLDQVPGTHRLRTVSSVGEAFPLTTTANGRACLARMDDEKAAKLVQSEWNRRGVSGDLTGFMGRLQAVRETRLAYDLGEHTGGICAIGFAFNDLAGDLYAISVPVPESRFSDVRQRVENALRETALTVDKMMASNS